MKPTEPAGRMAFKNYILMTIVATFIFNGHGPLEALWRKLTYTK
jgi:uncharacterized membrane protein YeiB